MFLEKMFYLFILVSLLAFFFSAQAFFMVFSLIAMILFSSVLFCTFSSKSWMMLLVYLVYLGGVLVLFLYLTSSNPKKSLFKKTNLLFLPLFILSFPFLFIKKTSLSWDSLLIGNMFFTSSESALIVMLLLFVLLVFLLIISTFLSSIFVPFRSV